MKKLLTLLIVLFGILLYSCQEDTASVNSEIPPSQYTASEKALMKSSNDFGLNLFRDLADDNPATKNLFISPLSVYLALTMTYNGAAGETAKEMQNTLGFSDMSSEDINTSCKNLVNKLLNTDPKVIMEIANSIWYRNTFEVKKEFFDLNQNYFNAEVKPSDFNDPATVGIINNWVKTKTHDKIPEVIRAIHPLAMMYLINAIYFKGMWKNKFDSDGSHDGIFYRSNTDTSKVVFMNQEQKFNYYENNILKALELPYGNSGFSMVVLLPSEGKSVGDIVSNFTPANWNSWNEGMDSIKVAVRFPRFKFAYDSVINESLKTLGMPKAFDQSKADFSNINSESQLFISFVLHKSFVEVNEEGTEAAAVTVVGVWTTSIDNPENVKYFNADRPFVFLIKENSTQTILFSGIMNNPIYE